VPLVRPTQQAPEEEDLATLAIKRFPPWLISAAVHMVMLILLGLMVLANVSAKRLDLLAEVVYAESLGEQLEFDSPLAGNDPQHVEEPVITPEDLPLVEDPFAAPPDMDIALGGLTATSQIEAAQIGLALKGRQEGMKRALLAAYGGTGVTQAAVERGLEWLARNQGADGSWSLRGPYADGAENENREAATAMALLAFLGDGHTHKSGKFKSNVAKAVAWLLKRQEPDGRFFGEGISFNQPFYTQGQCTIALCELYGMTNDPKLREPAERAVQFCLQSQASQGGWRYQPKIDSDTSVTGWIVMALQSARMAGLDVPRENLRRVGRFLDTVSSHDGSRYAYQRGHQPSLAMTAEALLCRQYLGWYRNDPRLVAGVEWITRPENLIRFERGKRDVYYWYYATQVAHHMEGEYWQRWNEVMRQIMPEQQVKKGRERGSWDPFRPAEDEWGNHGGRLYVTCLSIYMLEVYYRHLPLYSNAFLHIR